MRMRTKTRSLILDSIQESDHDVSINSQTSLDTRLKIAEKKEVNKKRKMTLLLNMSPAKNGELIMRNIKSISQTADS